MATSRLKIFTIITFAFLLFNTVFSQETAEKESPRPIGIEDAITWKSVRTTLLSNNGVWFAWRVSPNKGDSEIFVKNVQSGEEHSFKIGNAPTRGGGTGMAFSEDAKWLAFTIYPTEKEKEKLKKQKKKSFNKAGLVDLSSGEMQEFDQVKKYAFSNENPGWLALHKYPEEGRKKGKDGWSGTDLLLYDLKTKAVQNIGNVADFAFNKPGDHLAWTVDASDKIGNGVQLREMSSSMTHTLDSDTAEYKGLNWTEKGEALAVVKGKPSKDYEKKLFTLLGFNGFSQKSPTKTVYEPTDDESFPEGMTISPNRRPEWTADFSAILFGVHDAEMKEEAMKKEAEQDSAKVKAAKAPGKKKTEPETANLVIWHWKDKRMQSRQQVQENRDKNFSYLSIFHLKDKKFVRLADDDLRQVTPTQNQKWGVGIDVSPYEWRGNLDGQRFRDIYAVNMKTGARKLAVQKNRWYYGPSPDDRHFYFYNDGHFFSYEFATGKTYNMTEKAGTSFVNVEDDHNIVKPPIRPIGWAKSGKSVLLYDGWDVWNVDVHGGKSANLTVNGKKDGIRYRSRFRLDPEEKGIDLAGSVYFGAYGEFTKMNGIARVDKGKPGAKSLLWSDEFYTSLQKAKDADVFVYAAQDHDDAPDYFSANKDLAKAKKLTDSDAQQEKFTWSAGTRLVEYESDKGKKLQSVLYLPADYEEGQSYPTVVYIYEKLSQWRHRYFTPSAGGFNKSLYTSQGYAVLMPDIVYEVNDPGMSAVWCVVPAVKAAIETGVVDAENVAIHGHSWGGYQTSFLITQTEVFKAAAAGAPLTNMISMYSSIYWNSGGANQPIFESSQGRFTGGYWEELEAYTRNSPVYYAQKVKTPLLLLHNDKDGAVDWNQGIEYFNTLRRLEKPVVMLQYKGENHGVREPANRRDYSYRMLEFFDHYLKGKEAPEWLKQGVPHLEMKDHLKARAKKPEDKKDKKPKKQATD